jgi:hypothetical protein
MPRCKPKKKAVIDADDPFDGSSFGEMKKYANSSHIAAGLAHLTTSAQNPTSEHPSLLKPPQAIGMEAMTIASLDSGSFYEQVC